MYKNIKKYSELNNHSNLEKVGLFVVGHESPPYIRLLSIFNLLTDFYDIYMIDVTKEDEITKVFDDLENNNFLLDIIIVQRDAFISEEFLSLLFKKSKLLGIKLIYEIDDDLLNIDKTHRAYNYYSKKLPCIKFLIKNADFVTVSTERLKDKLYDLNKNIFIIPNVLTMDWNIDINKKTHPSDEFKIGYMGTHSHHEDLKLIKEAIMDIQELYSNKNIKIIFELIGGTAKTLEWANKVDIPNDCTLYPNFVKFLKQVDWDIAVAPLIDNNINSTKSPLKYIEYTGLEIPGVYSDIGPYKDCISNGKNGLLVKDNTTENWKMNIIKLIEDETLRFKIIENAKNDVNKKFSIYTSIKCWKDILNICKKNQNKNKLDYNIIKDSEKDNMEKLMKNLEIKINTLNSELTVKNNQVIELEEKNSMLITQLNEYETHELELNKEFEIQKKFLKNQIQNKEIQLNFRTNEFKKILSENSNQFKTQLGERYNKELIKKDDLIKNLEIKINTLNSELTVKNNQVIELEEKNSMLITQLNEYETHELELNKEFEIQKKFLKNQIQNKEIQLEERYNKELIKKDELIKNLELEIEDKNNKIHSLKLILIKQSNKLEKERYYSKIRKNNIKKEKNEDYCFKNNIKKEKNEDYYFKNNNIVNKLHCIFKKIF